MLLSLAALLVPLAPPAPQSRLVENDYDRIVLTDGKEVEGRVLFETEEVVVLRHGGKREKEYPRSEVAEVRSVERSLREFLDRVDALEDPDDMEALAALGTYCAEHGLPGEARLCWLYMLTRDPESEVAWTALEGRETRKGWELKDDKRWRTLEEFREHHSEWKHRLELRSTHFWLESDVSLEESIRVLVTLEEFYRVFYDVMTPTLRLYPFDELPLVQVTRDPKSYPTPPVPRDAWFAVARNTLNVLAAGEVDTGMIVREFTTGMLYNAFYNTTAKSGMVAPWVGRGLAEWFAGGATKGELRVELDLEKENTALFQRQAAADEILPLKRLFTLTHMEFETGPAADLGAAEAYTLLHFLLRGADREYRDGLIAYVEASYQGKGSVSNFQKLVTRDLDALEQEWSAYVAAKAR